MRDGLQGGLRGGFPAAPGFDIVGAVFTAMRWMAVVYITGAMIGPGGGARAAAPIYRSAHFAVYRDRVVEGAYSARAGADGTLASDYPVAGRTGRTVWRAGVDVSRYPGLRSDYRLVDALYRLSLEEMVKDIRSDGTFMAGEKWDGVWARDISYSIVLALAAIEPEVARASLLRKVRDGRIVQDTGSGGSWPVSSDRMTWALAAWEVYEVTGARDWLKQSYDVIRASAEDDGHVVVSPETGLVWGETTFLDWREQTYPRWMQPVDIYGSQALGTNAVHYRTYRILAAMARLLGEPGQEWDERAEKIRAALNERFWIEERGFYGQYLYGGVYRALSGRPDALGEALAMLFDIAGPERQDRMLRSTPVMEYGIPCVYPQTPGIPPYHNRAVWPFVQAFWNLAAARRADGGALVQGLASIWRAAALFQTNKENFVASSGKPDGTEINSSRQLWSVAADLAMVYRVLFGMEFSEEGLKLRPVVPGELKGRWTLEGFHYRRAVLRIRVEGFGRTVKRMRMDGKRLEGAIPAGLEGEHEVVVEMAGDKLPNGGFRLAEDETAPETPVARREGGEIRWGAAAGAKGYVVYRDGKRAGAAAGLSAAAKPDGRFAEYQVSAEGVGGWESFLSEPVAVGGEQVVVEAETGAESSGEDLHGFSGAGFVEIGRRVNRTLSLRARVGHAGRYRIAVRYSNGSGPVNTDNKCAIRTLFIDGREAGPVVMPQRGMGEWSNWGMSSAVTVRLEAGEHSVDLKLEPYDENMNGEVNRAMVDYIRLVKLD